MGTKIILLLLAIWAVAVVVGTSHEREKASTLKSIEKYDRRDPKSPMHGIYSDSNCSVEEQMKGIYKCP
jgi:hypothetical protein